MEKFGLRGTEFGFPKPCLFRRCRTRSSRINYTRNIVLLLFFMMFTHDMSYTPIGAVDDGGSGSDHRRHGKSSLESEGSDINWDERLLGFLVYVWTESNPATKGHAERMFQMWSSDPSHLPPISKEELYQTARQFIIEGKDPAAFIRRVKQEKRIPELTDSQKRKLWSEFRLDAKRFMKKLPRGRLKSRKPVCDLFLEKYHKYAALDRYTMSQYIYNERYLEGHTSRKLYDPTNSHPGTSYNQILQSSAPQHSDASPSDIPQIYPHLQGYSNPHESQPSYVDYAHGGMLDRTPRIPPYHGIYHSHDESHGEDSRHQHGESSSQRASFPSERFATLRLDHTSGEYGRSRRNQTRDQSAASTPREHDSDLDLDLHL